jgi:hypothetical protein
VLFRGPSINGPGAGGATGAADSGKSLGPVAAVHPGTDGPVPLVSPPSFTIASVLIRRARRVASATVRICPARVPVRGSRRPHLFAVSRRSAFAFTGDSLHLVVQVPPQVPPMNDEHRAAPRHRVLKAGTISFGGGGIDCTVRNISATGAALEVVTPLFIPDRFTLVIQTDQFSRPPHRLAQGKTDRRRVRLTAALLRYAQARRATGAGDDGAQSQGNRDGKPHRPGGGPEGADPAPGPCIFSQKCIG